MARVAVLAVLVLVGCRAAGTPELGRRDARDVMTSSAQQKDQTETAHSQFVNAAWETSASGADVATTADFVFSALRHSCWLAADAHNR